MPVRVISICHPLLLVSCNDRRGVDYATTLTQTLLQVLASYSMQRFSNSHVLTPIPMHLLPIPIPWLILLPFPWESHGTHGIPVFPIPMHTSSRKTGRRLVPRGIRRKLVSSGFTHGHRRRALRRAYGTSLVRDQLRPT